MVAAARINVVACCALRTGEVVGFAFNAVRISARLNSSTSGVCTFVVGYLRRQGGMLTDASF